MGAIRTSSVTTGDERDAAPGDRLSFMGVAFDRVAPSGLLDEILAGARSGPFRYVATPNVDHMLRISARPEIAALYRGAWRCINDSKVLAGLARISGARLPAHPGANLVADLLSGPRLPRDTPMIIVGGEPGLAGEIERRFGYTHVGQHRPPMGLLGNPAAFEETLEAVEASGAGLVFLAIGSPQQELVAAALVRRGRAVGIGLCIGAALEFLVGARRRAPRWMQHVGLEWAFRLVSEPTRLGRRYLVDGPHIFGVFLAHLLTRSEGFGG